MKNIVETDVILETRTCPSCRRTFKTHPSSPVIYDSYFCEHKEQERPTKRPLRLLPAVRQTVAYSELEPIPRKKWRKRGYRLEF